MDSSFEVDLTKIGVDPAKISEIVSAFAEDHVLLALVFVGGLLAYSYASTYRQRRCKERRLTGKEGSVSNVENLALPRGARAQEVNPALPAVRVRKESAPYKTISSPKKLWWVAGKDYDDPQMVAIGMTGAGKNQALLDPTAWNVLRYRDESAVIMDIKGDMIAKFAYRTRARQFAYSFLEEHHLSSAINLIETPKMAATTAAALYPVKGVKVPAFNMGARDLFEALAEALGYSRSNIVELFRYLKKPDAMNELARTNERLSEALTGENRKFVSDVISSARLPLAALNRPEVARVFAPDPDTPQPHFREKEVVWVCIPQDSEDVALLAGTIVHNLYNRAVKSRRGTYFLVDEAGSTITIENLDRYLQIGRGLGAYFFLMLQDISQLQDKIGSAKTRSVLGNAGVQFWGKSQDTETARYVSELSGSVQVRRAIYEHDGSERALKQMFSAKGAPFMMREETRAGLLPEHVHGLPKGWWYAYEGDPHAVELLIPAPMH
jgi:type IV secretory pathway TraG/TraD family ATPase VirD4